VRGDFSRVDNRVLGVGMSQNQSFEGRPAVQISRRSTHLDPRRRRTDPCRLSHPALADVIFDVADG